MKIGIDARILGEPGGIGEYIENLVLKMAEIHPQDEFVLFLKIKEFETKFFNPPVGGTNISAVTFRDRLVIPSLAPDKNELSSAGSLGIIKKVLADVPIYSLAEQCLLKKIFEKENLDILHVPHWNAPVFYRGKMIVTIHDLAPLDFVSTKRTKLSQWLRKKYFYLILKTLGQRAQKIIAISNLACDDLINRIKINPEKIEVIYSGVVSSRAYEEAAKISKEEARQMIKNEFKIDGPYFFAAGIWRTHKNLDGLISAFKKTLEMMPGSGTKLLIGGAADKSFIDVLNLFQKYKSDPDIIFLGMLNAEKQALFMRGALANILPSFLEGFGFFYLEALAAGGDLISSKNVGAKEVVDGNVEFFDPKNADELIQKMIEKIKNPEVNHHQFILKNNISWSDTSEKVYKIYQNVLDER